MQVLVSSKPAAACDTRMLAEDPESNDHVLPAGAWRIYLALTLTVVAFGETWRAVIFILPDNRVS